MMNRKHLSKRTTALIMACCVAITSCLSYAVYAYKTSIPQWIQGSARDSWGKEVEALASIEPNNATTMLGIKPTNLGLYHATWNHGPHYEFPYTGVTYMDTVESGDKPIEELEPFKGKLIYCASSHKVGADLRGGTQFFLEGYWDENKIPDWIVGSGDEKKFNFYMLVCAIGLADSLTQKKGGNIGSDLFGGVEPDYTGAAEFLATFPIVQQVESGDGFNMSDMNVALEQYRGNILVQRLLRDVEQNPAVKAELEKNTVTLINGVPAAVSYMDSLFISVWRAAYACMALHTASPEYVYEIMQEDDKKVVTVTCPLVPTDGQVSGNIYFDVTTYGDWVNEGYVYDESQQAFIYRIVSDSGIVPEDGIVAKLSVSEIRTDTAFFIASNNSKLATFKCWSRLPGRPDEENVGSFNIAQTFFSVAGGNEILIRAGGGSVGDGTVKVERFKHEEEWETHYNVDLAKFDSETGKALEGATFDILEKDTLDNQLPDTSLDDGGPKGGLDGKGDFQVTEWEESDSHDTIEENYTGYDDNALISSQVTLYNWGNDGGTQFTRWADPYEDACGRDINVTGEDGHLYYGDNYGNNSGQRAHSDRYLYQYTKGYCTGHPAPEIEYVEVPEEEYDEEGDVTNQDEIDAAIEENKRLHREAWDTWNREVETCNTLAEEGGFFHCITPGSLAMEAMQQDRDVFYVDYISLTYDYSAVETEAREGYILHGLHTDDIPVEWRTVTSSQYKDYSVNGISYNGGGGISEDDVDETDNAMPMVPEDALVVNPAREYVSDTIPVKYRESRASNFIKYATPSETSVTDDGPMDEDASIVDLEITAGSMATSHSSAGHESGETRKNATMSEAEPEGIKDLSGAKSKWSWTGFAHRPVDTIKLFRHIGTPSNIDESLEGMSSAPYYSAHAADDEEKENAGNKSGLRYSVSLLPSGAHEIRQGMPDILDWTFILYDHRTEGEIHINKRDLDLKAEQGGYGEYADSNGDGTLEGAVYGLFAAADIAHPDGKTGTVYKQGNLVAVATTDRNGDASFMAITEAPGYVYDYEQGRIAKTTDGFADIAPGNLHTGQDEAAGKQLDIEEFEGHNPDNSEITAGNGNDLVDSADADGTYHDEYYEKYSSNQGYDGTYREDGTCGFYPISNNEKNNGNCWIGRPLFVNSETTNARYFVKELSRSEGYELSVIGKDNKITNGKITGEQLNSESIVTSQGTATVTKPLNMNVQRRDNRFTITSQGTVDGYDVTLYNIPEHAEFSTFIIQTAWSEDVTHTETVEVEVPVIGTAGQPVLIEGKLVYAEAGENVGLPYGGNATVNAVSGSEPRTKMAYPKNSMRLTIPTFQGSVSDTLDEWILDAGWAVSTARGAAPENAPWLLIEMNGDTADEWAACLHDGMVAAGMEAFNRITLEGPVEIDGKAYAVVRYAYTSGSTLLESVYDEVQEILYMKQPVDMDLPSGIQSGFVYVPYVKGELLSHKETEAGFITEALVNRKIVTSGVFQYPAVMVMDTEIEMSKPYWIYDGTEQARNSDGSLATRKETQTVTKPGGYVTEEIVTDIRDVIYENGIYSFHMDTVEGDAVFKITYNTDAAAADASIEFAKTFGVIDVTPTLKASETYVEFVTLPYLSDRKQNSDAGTVDVPIGVFERPIRQKIRVNKDIQTIKETKQVWYCLNCGFENSADTGACGHCQTERTTEETKAIQYAHDTYSAVHRDNISADRSAGAYHTAKDWLARLLGKEIEGEQAKTIPNFRFKAYLKSNLERLYRDQDGKVVWMDRNGNTMTPKYADTNGDGNYDTFTWVYDEAYGGKEVDFPEKDKLSDAGALESSNVQKLYTKVEHNADSMTTSAQANNVWDDYDTPQGGNRDNVGEKEGFSTSQREMADGSAGDLSGKAVDGNAALYSYNGKNTDVSKSDRLNEEQNTGYTRLLEMRRILMEDGAGAAHQVEQYNYEKFFDAIAAANADIWDNDMHTTYTGFSMGNYPGQHWFETHYEKYQKDDADPDHTLENTDGTDPDHTAGGDRDTSFKPFRWIREHRFGDRDDYEAFPAGHGGANTEVGTSTSDFAKANAEASDVVRQFAVKWYLEDEAAKLMTSNDADEDVAKGGGTIGYDEGVYDEALFHAIAKTYNYLRPFYENDLDTIYSVEWDSAEGGGSDKDYTTLSIDINDEEEHYNVSSYLPYGMYVVVEQQPERRDGTVNDWENRSYTIEAPKEVTVPSVYDGAEANDTTDNYDPHYSYRYDMTAQDQAKNYLIRFAEEWAHNNTQDEREYVIRAHGYHGDYEVYKYGLDIDRLTGTIQYADGAYDYAGWKLAQGTFDPIKDYYDTEHRGETGITEIGTENGGNDETDYMAIHRTDGMDTANGSTYDGKPLQDRLFYGAVSEDAGIANSVMFKGGAVDRNNASGMRWEDGVRSMTGELTAYEGKYASMLVPWTVTAPADKNEYSSADFTGYADVNERDGFYVTKLRINKVDSETGEYILHDNAIFALYAGSRYNTFEEINADASLIADGNERAAFLAQFKPGDAKFYLKDTVIQGTREFLMAMGATDITPAAKGKAVVETGAGPGEICSGLVRKGTPICVESERIMLTDETGARTGQMTVYTTLNDVLVAGEKDAAEKTYANQNTGYFITPQPIGAGVYVLAEIKAPDGYARSKPVPFEVYSDQTQYYVDGDMYNKVSAVRYEENPVQ